MVSRPLAGGPGRWVFIKGREAGCRCQKSAGSIPFSGKCRKNVTLTRIRLCGFNTRPAQADLIGRCELQIRPAFRASQLSEGQVAQLVEQRTENPRVGGSIPPLATI